VRSTAAKKIFVKSFNRPLSLLATPPFDAREFFCDNACIQYGGTPMDILFLIAITFAAGVVGGLVLADAFDLEKM